MTADTERSSISQWSAVIYNGKKDEFKEDT